MYKQSKHFTKSRLRASVDHVARQSIGWTMAFSISAFQVLPVYAEAQIIADGRTQTSIINNGQTTDIFTNTFSGGNAFNSFERFSVGQLQTVNLHQPETAGALINVVRGGQTNIEGTLNAMKGGAVGGNVFIVNPDGIVVSAGGVINAGNLTMSTAQRGFADRLIGADGSVDQGAVAQLFAGTEPLSAEGAIALYGEINARRLEMRSGARMIVDGRITVVDPDGTNSYNPAVNTSSAAQASGVSVEGGVIRLFSGDDIAVSGSVSAQSGDNGGRIDMRAAGDITVSAGADIAADGAIHGGTAVLFADGSALLEQGARISATAIAGAGGFIEFSARDTVTLGGSLDVASASGPMGTVLIDPAHFVLADDLFTNGANWIIQADESITVTGRTISTRQVADGQFHGTAQSIGASGNLILNAPKITLDNAQIYTHGGNGHSGGLIALLARAETDGTDGLAILSRTNAEINITNSTLIGGAIYIGAYARARGLAGTADSGERPDEITDALFDVATDAATKIFNQEDFTAEDFVRYGNTLAGPWEKDIPLNVAFLQAAATININNSTLTADGNWTVATPQNAFEGKTETRGFLTADGLAEQDYDFSTDEVEDFTRFLAAAFDGGDHAIYIHSHAQTDVKIDAGENKLNLVVAVTNTDSRLNISNSTLRSFNRDIAIVSTASENLSVEIKPETYLGVTPGVVVSVRNLGNQLVVNGGSSISARDLTIAALTGLNHNLTTEVDGGKDAKFALAVAVSIGRTMTEAAVGGQITVTGDMMLAAETIFFNKTHKTTATLGTDDPTPPAEDEEGDGDGTGEAEEPNEDKGSFNDSVLSFLDAFKKLALGQSDEETDTSAGATTNDTSNTTTPPASQTQGGDSKRGFAGALAVDVVFDDNNTFVTLGGSYRNLDDGDALVALGATNVTVTGDLTVNANFRFASDEEGGSGLSREVTSTANSLSDAQKKALEEENKKRQENGEDPKTEEEFINEFGYGVFLNVPVTLMTGTTQAELGGATTQISAANVTATATTSYPNARPWEDLLEKLKGYRDQVTEFVAPSTRDEDDDGTETGAGDSNFAVPTSLKDIIDLDDYLTTKTGASGGAPSASSEGSGSTGGSGGSGDSASSEKDDQELAIGITVSYFSTSNTTRAVIRDGVTVNTGELAVNARAEGFFFHRANDIELPSLDGGEGANNAIGGAINVARTANVVEALVEGAAKLTAGNITLDARNDVQSVIAVYAGGNASQIAINAAVGAIILQNRTVARISDGADLTVASTLTLRANDGSAAWNAAGAASVSGNVSVGASGTVNFLSRDTQAIIGSGDGSFAADAGDISAQNIRITAENSGIQISAAVAGAVVAGEKPDTSPTPPTPPSSGDDTTTPPATEDDDDDMIIPSWLFSEDENDALNAQNKVDVPTDDSESSDQKSAGWAVSASAALNLLLQNNVTAGMQTRGTVTVTDDLTITAKNTGLGLALGGAISASTDSQKENSALAGGFAVTVDSRDTIAYLRDATVSASSIALSADDTSYTISIAVGGAGTSKGKVALAGSVAVNVVTGVGDNNSQTAAYISDAALEAEEITLDASDDATIVGAGGAVAINLDKAGAAGVGLGVSVNVVNRDVAATVTGASSLTADDIAISATMRAALYGFAISAGVGKTGVAGSVTVNTVSTGATAGIFGSEDDRITVNTNALRIKADENAVIWSLAGAIAGGFKTAAGGALTINVISADTEAGLVFADVQQQGGMPALEPDPALPGDDPTEPALPGDDDEEAEDEDTPPFQIISSLDAVSVTATSRSRIGTLAAAGSGGKQDAVGLGMSGNAILASTIARMDDSAVNYAASVNLLAHSDRAIRSLGGAAAFAGRNAVGGAVTVNVIDRNTTLASLDRANIITLSNAITARAQATSLIESVAVALGASGKVAVSGSVTINVTTGETMVRATDAQLTSAKGIDLRASDQSDIRSLAGGAAFGGTVGIGAAIAANVLAHDTAVILTGGALVAEDGDIALTATNDAQIDTLSVGIGATGGNTAFAGSVVVAYIGNAARVSANDVALDAGAGKIDLNALKTSRIRALAGAAAGSGGGGAVGAAITAAIIHDTVSAELATNRALRGGDLAITATNQASIDAIAASGAASGDSGFAGSIVFTMIGKPPAGRANTPAMQGLAEGEDDPIAGAQTTTEGQRDLAFDLVGSESALMRDRMAQERASAAAATPNFALGQQDLTYAGLTIGAGGSLDVASITVNAREMAVGGTDVDAENPSIIRDKANLRSFAGAFGAGGTGGVGAAFTVNLLFGETIAEVNLPSGNETLLNGELQVLALQDGVIQTAAASAGVAGTAGVAGSITVNVMNRALRAGLYGDGGLAQLATEGSNVQVRAVQTGLIQSLAGAVGAGGDVGVGVAVGVNVMADSATSEMRRVRVNTSVTPPVIDPDANEETQDVDLTPGNVAVTAQQDLALYGFGLSIGAAGTVGVSGSFAINVNQAKMTARIAESDIRANQVDLRAIGDAQVFSLAGAIAASGTVAVGLGAAINVSSMTVLADFDASRIIADDRVRVEAVSFTGLSGNAIGGAASGTVSVAGTVVTNVATNQVDVRIRNTTGVDVDFDGDFIADPENDDAGTDPLGSEILTSGSVLVRAEGRNTISLLGGAKTADAEANETTVDGAPTLNISFAIGGSAGVGGSVSVNRTANRIATTLTDGARVTGLGHSTATSATLGQLRGVAVEANAETKIVVLSANASAGLYAGVSGVFGFNIADDSARVRIGDGTVAGAGAINAKRIGDDGEVQPANIAQDSLVSARVKNDLSQFNVAIGAGVAGVGAASGTTLVTSVADVTVDRGQIAAANHIGITALTDTTILSIAVGAAGGAVGVGGSVGVNIMQSQALVTLRGANIGAGRLGPVGGPTIVGGSVAINADAISRTVAATGAIAVGAAAAAAAIQVNKFDSTARIAVLNAGTGAGNDPFDQTRIDAGQDVSLDARNQIDNVAAAVGGAVSMGFALAASINVNLVQADTEIMIDRNQRLTAGRDLRLSAREDVDLRNASGAVALDLGGGAGIGAALDLAIFSSQTNVTVGNESALLAGRDMNVTATANRRLDSSVIVGAAGASLGLSAAISVVQMGQAVTLGDSENEEKAQTARNDLLAEVQKDLDGDQTTNDPNATGDDAAKAEKNSIQALTARGGGDDVRTQIVAARQNVDVTGQAAVPDDIGVSIGAGATLRAGQDLTITSTGNVSVSQLGGSLGAGLVGISAGVLVANVGVASTISIGAGALLGADRDIRLIAQTRPLNSETLRMRAYSAGGGAVAISAGIAVGATSSEASITIAEGAEIAGNTTFAARNVTLQASRSDVIDAQVLNLAVGLAGVGLVVVHASNTGRAAITMAGSQAAMVDIRAANINATLRDGTRTLARGIGAAGGFFAAGNATVVIANNTGEVDLILSHAALDATNNITLQSLSEAEATARADGVAVSGGASIGASFAQARNDARMTTSITNGMMVGTNITIDTLLRAVSGRNNAGATAFSASGGSIAGNGAEARAFLDYTIATTYSGLFYAGERLAIAANSSGGRGAASASGVSAGIIAVGAVLATVGSSENRTSSVTTDIRSGYFEAGSMQLRNTSGASFTLNTTAGSGGVGAGSASVGTTRVLASSATDIGTAGAVDLITTGMMDMATGHDGTVRSEMNNINATLVGVSGVSQTTTYATTAQTRLRSSVNLRAGELDLRTSQSVQRARATGNNGFNIRSGSGGALDVAAIRSTVTLDAATNTNIDSGARLTQTLVNPLNEPDEFRIGAASNLNLTDRVLLDAGGAIAIPRGESEIRVTRDDTAVNIGNSNIWAEGVLLVSSGSNVNMLAEVDANSYGLAGAASGKTLAVYNGNNLINIASGALIEGMRDIELRAGQIARQTQVVTVRAETRLFNKTAIPIPTDPAADAVANTTSRVTINEGARIEAVQDIYINAIGGTRDVTGYGRGKDLWREVAAAIANAIGAIFGADPVALDIKSGTSTDNRDNGIIVNGYVRAGSRNSQRLLLNQQNQIDTTIEGYEEWEYENIDWRLIQNFGVAGDLQQRVDELNRYISDWQGRGDDSSKAAVTAWTAERNRLLQQIQSTGGQSVDLIDVGAIRATGGSIFMRADYVHGSDTGTLQAPGEATIDILVTSTAFLRVDRLTIPARSGGRVTLNDVDVNSAADIQDLTGRGGAAQHGYAVIAGLAEDGPLIRVQSAGVGPLNSNDPVGTIIINGDIENLRGTVEVVTQEGDIDVRADVAALTIKMAATNGNFIQGYTPGITNVGGTPVVQAATTAAGELVVTLEGQYGRFMESVQRQNENRVRNASADAVFYDYRSLPTIDNSGGIRAGKNVFISADTLNINGLIQAGRGAYAVVINEVNEGDLWNEITARYGANGSGRVLIHNPAERDEGDVVRSAFINSDVPVYWNYDENRIEVARMIVQGGQVDLVGNIISTGNGRIEALDGFGEITLDSNTKLTIALTRIDTGGSGTGVEGVVRITDTSKTSALGDFLTTEYRRLDGAVTIYNNDTVQEVFLFADENVVDGNGNRPTRLAPSNVVATLGAGSRTASYAPTEGRDLILLTGERIVTTFNMLDKELVVIGIRGARRRTETTSIITNIARTQLGPAPNFGSLPYLGESLSGQSYDYVLVSRQLENTTVQSPKIEVHNSVRWWKLGSGWIHRSYTRTQTTEQLYEHRLNASRTIDIAFGGSDVGALNLRTAGDLIFADTVINAYGQSIVTSTGGSVRTDSNEVELNTANLSITAGGGSITGNGDAFNINQFAGATLTLTARDNIFLRETGGDMNLISAISTAPSAGGASSASSGNIHLIARGDLVQGAGDGLVQGANIRLESITGSIGGADAPVRTDLVGGRLNADAARDIAIREVTGDLGVDTVRSRGGSVYLESVDGSITDRNNIEERDIRTEAELTQLYAEGLGLFGDGLAAREAEQLAALRAQRERLFDEYWADRAENGGQPVPFVLDQPTRDALETAGNTAMVDAYVASREALYAAWNAQTARNDADALIGLTDEFAATFEGAGWTTDQLTQTLSAGLVRRTGDTTVRVEDPNIIANGDIVLRAAGSVGELTPDYIINPNNQLTAADLLVLGAADRLDLFDEDGNLRLDADGNIRVVQREDVNFAFTGFDDVGRPLGNLTIIANGREIFVGAETAAAIRQVDGTGDVQILINGAMTDASGDDAPAVRGSILVLESGNQHSIGTEDKPLSIEILPGGSLNARSGRNVFVTAPFGSLPIEALFAGQTASVTARDGITDNVGSALPRIVARDILLDGGSIGEEDNLLGIELTDETDGRITLTTRTGAIYLDVVSEMNLARAELAFGGLIEARKGVTLYGNDTLRFGLASTLRLDTQTGILRAGTTGTNITGGTLNLFSGGNVGSGDLDRLTTALAELSFTGWGAGPTALWVDETDAIRIAFVTQSDDAASETDIVAGGDISLGIATSQSRTRLAAGGSVTEGTIIAAETTLEAGANIGNLSRIEVDTGLFRAETTDGDATIALRNRAVDVDYITIGGDGDLDLVSTDAPLRLLGAGDALNFGTGLSAGAGISTAGGDMRLDLTSLLARADVTSAGGDIALILQGDLVQTNTAAILSETGSIDATIGGTLAQSQAARIASTTGAITLDVGLGMTQADGSAIASDSGDITVDVALDVTQTEASQITANAGAISLTSGGALLLADGSAISTDSGAITVDVALGMTQTEASSVTSSTGAIGITVGGDLQQADASVITSESGDITLTVARNLTQSADSLIDSGAGALDIGVGGDFDLAFIRTTNATDDALRLIVDGTLRKVATTGLNIDAASIGGLSTVRLGALAPFGPVGLQTDIDRLDIIVATGDMHINDQGRMTVEQALAQIGNVDIFVDGEMVVRNARALKAGQSHVTLSALGDIRSDDAVLQGDIITLFSFDGQITGETQDYFQGDVTDGNDLRLLAENDIRYREMAGDLLSQFALAGNGGVSGDLIIDVVDGGFTAGLLGAVGTVDLRAADVKVALIGRGSIDIADESGLQLVRPAYYGTVTAQSPQHLRALAYRDGGRIDLGLANLRQTAMLYADVIDGRLYDMDQASNLTVTMTNPTGDFVSEVYLRVVGDGDGYTFADPVTPFTIAGAEALYNEMVDLVANRLFAQTGTLFLQDSMIGTGEVIHAGPYFVGTDNRINGDVYFRQRTFDLYAHILFRFLDTEADAQVYATDQGKIGFTILDELILTTQDVLVLNRKLAGVSLDGGQGYTPDVGVETEILGGSFIRGTARGGVLDSISGALEILLAEEEEEEDEEGETGETAEDDTTDPAGMDPALMEHLRASL
jgi:filamentous hemagglutinin family protein